MNALVKEVIVTVHKNNNDKRRTNRIMFWLILMALDIMFTFLTVMFVNVLELVTVSYSSKSCWSCMFSSCNILTVTGAVAAAVVVYILISNLICGLCWLSLFTVSVLFTSIETSLITSSHCHSTHISER